MPAEIYWQRVPQEPRSRTEQLVEFVLRTLVTAAAVWVASRIVGGIHLDGLGATLLVATILGLLNASLKPLLFFGALPLVILTLGIGLIIINAALLGLTAWIAGILDISFAVDGFWAAFWGAVIISLVSFVLTRFFNPKEIARNLGDR